MRASLSARLRARPMLAAAVIYAVLSVLMVGPGLLPGRTLSASDFLFNDAPWASSRPPGVTGLGSNFELADAADVFQPFLDYTARQLPHIPLWNPYISGGRPYLGNAQAAIFSPFTLPAYIFSLWRSLAVIAALKLFAAALGAFALARALGMRFGGALLSGLVFAFGTFFVIWLAWPLTNIFAIVPWLLVLADRLVRRPGPLPAAGLAAVVALSLFGGHPETSFHALFVTGVFFLFRLGLHARRQRAGPRAWRGSVLAFAAALIAGTALAAVMLIPFAELLAHSGDLARRQGQAPGHWPRKYIGALFLHDYWGRATQNSNIEPFMQLRGWYAGALTLMLALAGLIIRPTVQRIGVALFALFTVSIVLGLPPVFQVVTALPGFSTAHNERMLIFFLLCVALLAGWGLDELSARNPLTRARRRAVLGAGLATFLVPVAWMVVKHTLTTRGLGTALGVAWGFQHPPALPSGLVDLSTTPQAAIVRMSSLLQWLPLAGIGLVLIGLRLRRARPLPVTGFVTLAVLLLAADLFRANMGFNPAIPIGHARMPVTGAIRYLQAQRPNRFVGVSTNITFQPFPADTAMYYGLSDARGYDYPAEKHYDTLWRRNVAPGVPDFAQPIETAGATPASLRALDLLSVGNLLTDPRAPRLREPGLSVAYRGSDATVYRNAQALPRVFLAATQQPVSGDAAALAAATAPGFDRRHVVVTERPLAGLPTAAAGTARSPQPGSASFVSYGAERVVAQASSRAPGMLVLTDISYPGWRATLDGRPTPLTRVDYLLRGVRVPPGQHQVVFSYAPASFRAGWIVSLIALLSLGAAVLIGVARSRRRTRTGAPNR